MCRYQTDLPDGVGEMNDRLVAEAEAGEYPPGVQVRGQAEHGTGGAVLPLGMSHSQEAGRQAGGGLLQA